MVTIVDANNLARVLRDRINKRLSRLAADGSDMTRVMRSIGLMIETEAKLNIRAGGTGPNKQSKGMIDSGALINSIFSEVQQKGPGLTNLLVGSKGVVYAAIHEFGGTIVPKRAKWLTLPLTKQARDMKARDFQDTFFLTSRRGNLFIARQVGDNIETLYLLRKQVNIPERPYLRPAMVKVTGAALERFRALVRKGN